MKSNRSDTFDPRAEPLPDDFQAAVEPRRAAIHPIASVLQYFPVADSTNDLALRLAAGGGHEGAVVLAGEQRAGRGRRGRTWFSPPGSGLYVSVVLMPGRTRADAARATRLLTLTVGVALVEAIEVSTGLVTHLKWPNDVYVSTRKLAGILAEASSGAGSPSSVVVGYGINVAISASPPELRSRITSLESELGRPVDGAQVFAASLSCLARRYEDLVSGRFDAILDAWRAHAPSSRGTSIASTIGETRRTGVTAGIDSDGALLVDTGNGIDRIVAGEIEWIW